MLIFIDLDGTLVDTIHPSWAPLRDGQEDGNVQNVYVFPGAMEFLNSFREAGHSVVLVSDSHPRYVSKFKAYFGLDGIDLADKPNTFKLMNYIASRDGLLALVQDRSQCFFIGDTKLDIEMGRILGIRTILLTQYRVREEDIDWRNGVGDVLGSVKMGPTYYAKNFAEVTSILNAPESNLYSIEGAFAGFISRRAVEYPNNMRYRGLIRCLARQEQGTCDPYARADKYYQISNDKRPYDFLKTLADGVKFYIDEVVSHTESWDTFTYLTDKSTTQPPNKMKEIFDLVDTVIPKQTIFAWSEQVQGSLRDRYYYSERREFLNQYLHIVDSVDLNGKNIIVLDDQLTTGATAFHVIKMLRELGAHNVMVIAMFQMILPVSDGKICPRCGQKMSIKIKRNDGKRFYSCVPKKFKGTGCGYIENID